MASIACIKGISYAPYRGGWKLRWRELHETESGVVRKARSYTVVDEAEVPMPIVFVLPARIAHGRHARTRDDRSTTSTASAVATANRTLAASIAVGGGGSRWCSMLLVSVPVGR